MVPELGHYSIIMALSLSLLQWILPSIGIFYNQTALVRLCKPLSLGISFFVILAYGILNYGFVNNDFTLSYVATHSNSALPLLYKIGAVWGGHEGSALLWVLFLSLWLLALTQFINQVTDSFKTMVLSVVGFIMTGLLLFIVITSNPFLRLLPDFPLEGRDLNPLLQDLGLMIHPPFLYLGYSACAIPFAFSLSALILKHLPNKWSELLSIWVVLAWTFLTIGILLGSFWAYYELGWGGWWFWDPVENASLMPWLIGIVIIHLLKLNQKTDNFFSWTFFLSIILFALSLLGTFLVRSGIVTSVHSFALDPKRGVFILYYFLMVIGLGLMIYSIRVRHFIKSLSLFKFSKETFILIGILLIIVLCSAVLIGTLFPLIIEVYNGSKISVGFPYFNTVFIPIVVPILLIMPAGPLIYWKKDTGKRIIQLIYKEFVMSLLIALIINTHFYHWKNLYSLISLMFFNWIMIMTIKKILISMPFTKKIVGFSLAHIGVGVMGLGVGISANYSIEKELRMKVGDTIIIKDYPVTFKSLVPIEGSNYLSQKAEFAIYQGKKYLATIYPEKRYFLQSGMNLSETAIHGNLFRDIYVALGEKLTLNEWSVRIYYKPLIRLIWVGALLMALGGFTVVLTRTRKV